MPPSKKWPHCPPPHNFVPAGVVTAAELQQEPPPFIARIRATGARAEGLRYERKGQRYFEATYPEYVAGPWIRFRTAGAWRWCQPDGFFLGLRRGLITVVEFKLQHTSAAWWQVRHLYEPVLASLFGVDLWQFAAIEVVSWCDPHTAFPEHFTFLKDPSAARPGSFNVHIWRG